MQFYDTIRIFKVQEAFTVNAAAKNIGIKNKISLSIFVVCSFKLILLLPV